MIITKISNLNQYTRLNPLFAKLIDYLENNDLEKIQEGYIEIYKDDLYGNCFNYMADGVEGDIFEAHQKYLDIHLVIENTEKMAISTINNCNVTKEYDELNDIEFYEGIVEHSIQLRKGDCLITFPEDLHQPKIKVNDNYIKKIVFKVRNHKN